MPSSRVTDVHEGQDPIKGPDISGLGRNWVGIGSGDGSGSGQDWVGIGTGDGSMGLFEDRLRNGFGRGCFAKGTGQVGKGESKWPIFVRYVRLRGAKREKGSMRDKLRIYFAVNEM